MKEENILYWGNRGGMMEFCCPHFAFLTVNLKAQDLLTIEAEIMYSVSYEITLTIKKIAFILVLGNSQIFYAENSKNFNAENSQLQDPHEHMKALH